jgi:hypothetical protein
MEKQTNKKALRKYHLLKSVLKKFFKTPQLNRHKISLFYEDRADGALVNVNSGPSALARVRLAPTERTVLERKQG